MLHDVRIIPLDGRPQLPQNVRQWMGSYRGHWEGDTLNAANQSIGQFSGSVTINRFANTQTNQIVALGTVRGVVTHTAGQVMKTGLQTIVLPVNLSRASAVNFKTPLSGGPRVMRASLTTTTAGSGRFMLAQAAQTCGILHLDIGGATALNLLGFMVNLTPITLDISGDSAGPLGALVCQIVALLGSVADVVGLLNSLLGLLTGLLGGLTGGLGGALPI
jgi:hypothetical protein